MSEEFSPKMFFIFENRLSDYRLRKAFVTALSIIASMILGLIIDLIDLDKASTIYFRKAIYSYSL